MLKIPFLHSTVWKLFKIGIRLLNSVNPVGLVGSGINGVPVSQSSSQGQQMANSGNTKPPFGGFGLNHGNRHFRMSPPLVRFEF